MSRFTVLCGPGTNFHYFAGVGPMGTGSSFGQLTCPAAAGGLWTTALGIPVNSVTCMSDT